MGRNNRRSLTSSKGQRPPPPAHKSSRPQGITKTKTQKPKPNHNHNHITNNPTPSKTKPPLPPPPPPPPKNQQQHTSPTLPFSPRDRILLIGEGDLSFARSLLQHHRCADVTATVYESEAELREKYPHVGENIDAIEALSGGRNCRGGSGGRRGERR